MPRLLEWATLNTACCPRTPWPKATTVYWASNGRSVRAVSVQSQRDELYCQVYPFVHSILKQLSSVHQHQYSGICLPKTGIHHLSPKTVFLSSTVLQTKSCLLRSVVKLVICHLFSINCYFSSLLEHLPSTNYIDFFSLQMSSDNCLSPSVVRLLYFTACPQPFVICILSSVIFHLFINIGSLPSLLHDLYFTIFSNTSVPRHLIPSTCLSLYPLIVFCLI